MYYTSESASETWIATYCALPGHEYLAEVPEYFITDTFNLTGLSEQVPLFKDALELMLDMELDDEDYFRREERLNGEPPRPRLWQDHHLGRRDTARIDDNAGRLYGLIHQRYITTRTGLREMLDKYELGQFGLCPRVYCRDCRVLPVGLSDEPCVDSVKLFCPSCLDVYQPPQNRSHLLDGSCFGTTFPYLFFLHFRDLDVGAPFYDLLPSPSISGSESPFTPWWRRSKGPTMLQQQQQQQQPHPSLQFHRDTDSINGVLTKNIGSGLGHHKIYEPKIYGFRISERSIAGPRMKWLRSKPIDMTDIDEASMNFCDSMIA